MRSKYYVGVIEDNKIRYVTKVDHQTHSAEWKEGLSALAMPKKVAEDVAFGLRINSIRTVAVIRLPWYEEVYNRIEDEWFGIVRWCEDDIRAALIDRGFKPTKEAIALVRFSMENGGFDGHQIEAGWDYIDSIICNAADDLEREEE